MSEIKKVVNFENFQEFFWGILKEEDLINLENDFSEDNFKKIINAYKISQIIEKIKKKPEIKFSPITIRDKGYISDLIEHIDFNKKVKMKTIGEFISESNSFLKDDEIKKIKDTQVANTVKKILQNYTLEDLNKNIFPHFNMVKDKSELISKTELIDELISKIDFSVEKSKMKKVDDVDKDLKKQDKTMEVINSKNIESYFNRLKNSKQFALVAEKNNEVEVTREIVFYNNLSIDYRDNYIVNTDYDIINYAVLVGQEDKYLGHFSLLKNPSRNEYHLLADKNNFDLKNRTNKNYYLCLFSKNDEKRYIVKINLVIKELEETNELLCIDFGTSNTSAGVFLPKNYIKDMNNQNSSVLNKNILLDEVNFVKFRKEKENPLNPLSVSNSNYVEISPSVLYIESSKDKNNIKYLFGYDAVNKIKSENYFPKGKVLRSIKKWLNSLSELEEIFDEKGDILKIERKTILRDYLNYIITNAEQQFKCKFKNLHFTAPIKLKSQYIRYFKEILSESYNIKSDNESIDEGFASLYNIIKNNWSDYQENKQYKALIIDSGGGTTDLSSCSFKKEATDVAYRMDITASSSDGDSNFGGDNITERIMQYMKIAYANHYSKNKINIDNFISPDLDVFVNIEDNKGVHVLYKKFLEEYARCEDIIPTNYKNYKTSVASEYEMVLNNYYFLWELAEDMKKEFFLKTSIQRTKFTSKKEKEDEGLNLIFIDKWVLSYYDETGKLKRLKENEFYGKTFQIREINQLIKGDVFNVIRKLLGKMYKNKELSNYNIIKLSGQSCKIDLFKESLKEYIAGRAIKTMKQSSNKNDYLELKLGTLRGAIAYFKDIDDSIIDPIKIESNFLIPIHVITENFRSDEIVLIDKNEDVKSVGHILKPNTAGNISIIIKDDEKNELNRFSHKISKEKYREITFKELIEKYKDIITQNDNINLSFNINNLSNKQSVFLSFMDLERGGFYILNIKLEEDKHYEGEKVFYSFEEVMTRGEVLYD